MVLNVADVSSNNTADKSKGNNYLTAIDENDAVIIKVTEGLTYVNPLANDQYTYAKNKNKLIGLYHFIVGGLSPQQQAQYFFNNAKNYILNQPTLLMLDWERPASYPALTGDEPKAFADELTKLAGRRPIIYMSTSDFISSAYNWGDITPDYSLMIAGYPLNDGSRYTQDLQTWADNSQLYFANPKYKNATVAIWQYTSVPYDLSVFYGDKSAWLKYGGEVTPTPTPDPDPDPTPTPDPDPTPTPTPSGDDPIFHTDDQITLKNTAYASAYGTLIDKVTKSSFGTIVSSFPYDKSNSHYAYLVAMHYDDAVVMWHFLEQDLQKKSQ